jgi:hypothetical protein
MAAQFKQRGYEAISLTGTHSESEPQLAMRQLADAVVQPYIYIGKGVYLSHIYKASHKPITLQLSLDNVIPTQIYAEFVTTS